MSTKKKKIAPTGIRYSDAQKNEVVDFVASYNAANGRGGQSVASAKFKVTPLTVAAWLKKFGKVTKGKKVAKPVKKASASASSRGVRYTPEKKAEVVDFVANYNAANGRGGQNQAAKKFNLSVLTVSAWLKASGKKGAKGAVKTVSAAKPVVAVKSSGGSAPSGLAAKVATLAALVAQVGNAEKELEKLYSKQDALLASIKGWV
ncbi:MAG: hypothetical protein H8M99_00870 [Gloeobacteraceae cyanobacterium ES-bin-144]|nr:hypothetical protein [Verrucomicrobiales bacterium]